METFLKSCLDILHNGRSKFDELKAINEFLTLITLKLVGHRIRDVVVNGMEIVTRICIGSDCKITYLYDKYCQPKQIGKPEFCRKLFDLVYNKNRIWETEYKHNDEGQLIEQKSIRNKKKECIIVRFNKHTENLHSITGNSITNKAITCFEPNHAQDVQLLIQKIHETFINVDYNKFDYDAFGEAYEKMMADELGNGSKRYGQYFTRRDVIEYIINELDVKATDRCYDPTVGTGGFILGFGKKYKNNSNFIANNIFGGEILEEVYMTMAFNMLSFNIDKCLKNIELGSSLSDRRHAALQNTIDKCGGNPPYGMSIKDGLMDIYPIKVKDSTANFLQHIYFMLKIGGRAGIVIDRGILNNGTDKKIVGKVDYVNFFLKIQKLLKL